MNGAFDLEWTGKPPTNPAALAGVTDGTIQPYRVNRSRVWRCPACNIRGHLNNSQSYEQGIGANSNPEAIMACYGVNEYLYGKDASGKYAGARTSSGRVMAYPGWTINPFKRSFWRPQAKVRATGATIVVKNPSSIMLLGECSDNWDYWYSQNVNSRVKLRDPQTGVINGGGTVNGETVGYTQRMAASHNGKLGEPFLYLAGNVTYYDNVVYRSDILGLEQ
jgi:hypothetical protein